METNKQSLKINKLAEEKDSLLKELGIKMRKKVYRLGDKLAFVVDQKNVSIEITNADYIGETDIDEAAWEKLKLDSKENEIEVEVKDKKIKSFKIVPKNDEEVESPGVS